MATFAPPIYRDKFLFSSVLYADAGSQNHHPRASIAELTALLRPDTPKLTKKATAPQPIEPAKDQVGHWYTAQLIHYGLPPTKDKNAAKVRLLNVLNEGKLEVPTWITKLEAEIKKQWEGENRKLKKAAKDANGTKSSETPGKKVKEKKESKVKPAPTPGPRLEPSSSTGEPKSSQGKRKRDDTNGVKSADSSKKSKPTKSEVHANSAKPAPLAMPKKTGPSPKVAAAVDEYQWPSPTKNIIGYHGPFFLDPDPYRHSRPPNAPRAGVWEVSCPDVETDWPDDFIDEFHLAFSATEDEWWSRFKWGNFQGVIVVQRIPKKTSRSIGVPFKWRAHHNALGQDGEGAGKLFFTSQHTFKGEFHDFFRQDPCYFQCKKKDTARRSGPDGPCPSLGTPVLDRLRVEWSEMPAVMRDASSKKAQVNKGNGPADTHTQIEKENIKSEPKPRVKKKATIKEPKPQAPSKKASRPIKPEPQTEMDPNDMVFSGTYRITCPNATNIFPHLDPTSLRLTLCKDDSRWWASFSWGLWDGIIQMDPGPSYETLDQPCTLGWRLRDRSNGELRFGRRCTGDMTFYRDCTIRAYLHEIPRLGTVEFWGPRLPGPREIGFSGADFRREWDSFVAEAYGRQ